MGNRQTRQATFRSRQLRRRLLPQQLKINKLAASLTEPKLVVITKPRTSSNRLSCQPLMESLRARSQDHPQLQLSAARPDRLEIQIHTTSTAYVSTASRLKALNNVIHGWKPLITPFGPISWPKITYIISWRQSRQQHSRDYPSFMLKNYVYFINLCTILSNYFVIFTCIVKSSFTYVKMSWIDLLKMQNAFWGGVEVAWSILRKVNVIFR